MIFICFVKWSLLDFCNVVGKLMHDVSSGTFSLVVVAVTNAFALSSAVYVEANISGGHVNLAIIFGMVVGGHISVPTALFY
jgi:aquaporin TIP